MSTKEEKNENQQYKGYNREAKEKESIRSEAIKPIINYYKNTNNFRAQQIKIGEDTFISSKFCARNTKQTIQPE